MQTNKRAVLWVGIGGLLCLSVFRLWKIRWSRYGAKPRIQDKKRSSAMPSRMIVWVKLRSRNDGRRKAKASRPLYNRCSRHHQSCRFSCFVLQQNDNDDVCDNNANEERQIDDVDIRAERERLSREKQIRAAKEKDCFPSNRSRSCSM